ncbi:hypothetical protein FHX74_000181 [Friedmanniella endophytica]|uniref:FAD-binding PCMH-type domain-containing protein n=1 Tax=Microlunatus kandeliicorticis TaxID=1759536 RepID=A0A7W3IP15_9ACTN|nr:FAD-binding oxidoreductase [Microlunatus kandeliicorticis]MBA8792587.1 hypothetical protein [Microlunatus kandeliicorticis]
MTTVASPISTSPTTDPTAGLDLLAATLRGRLLLPDHPDFLGAAMPWNVAVPADATAHLAVVEAADAADVAATVRHAAGHGLTVTVRATGHGAYAVGGPSVLLRTGALQELTVDPATRIARVGAGVKWAQVLEAAAPHGLAGLAGSSPDVGVVGYLTGGGLGPVARSYGWASDRVVAFDVVTGDGELRRATATENPALFWALRGGKGALGIVTAVEFELVELAELVGGCLFFAAEHAAEVLRAWAAWAPALPREVSTSVALLRLPPMPGVPEPLAGRTTLAVRFADVGGDPERAQALLAPVTGVAAPVFGGVGPMPYAAIGMIHADPVDPMPSTETATLLAELPEAAVETLLALAGPDADQPDRPCPQIIVELRLLGGALAEPGATPSALCHREAAFTLLAISLGVPPVVGPAQQHAAALLDALAPWSLGGASATNLPNFSATADPAGVARMYDAATFARLGSLADSYDPHRVLVAAEPFRG